MKSISDYPFFKKSILLLFMVSIGTMSFAQSKLKQLDKLISTYESYGKFNGSVLVSNQGEVIYKKGFGMANMEWDIPNQPNTKHRLGSITKQFTAMLILQLAAEGKLDLQKPITTYLPDYPKATGDIITTHHLLTHTAGIQNYTSFPKFMQDESRNPYTPDAFVKKFDEKELDFTPGERFSYSNSGYFLLGVIAEKLTGKSYEDLLHERIFTPLKMNDTGYDNHGDILKNRATGYEKQGNSFTNSRYLDMTIPYAAGSMYSTVEDLYIWDQALYTTTLLPKKYMKMYFEPYISAFGDAQYAYGWAVGYENIGSSNDSIYSIGHGGGINGFNTNISRTTSDKSVVVLLNNTGGAPLGEMTRAIRGIMHGTAYDMPKKSVADAISVVIGEKGIAAAIVHYNNIKDDESYELSEREMNNLGYELMGQDNAEGASKVFQLNVDAFPNSSNTYDSLGESFMKLGKKELAIKNYRKSVKLNPNNQGGIKMLKQLGDDVGDLEKEVTVADAILEIYIGKYELAPSFTIDISKVGGQLKAQATGQQIADVFPKSDTEFYLKVVDAQLVFNKTADGNVTSLTLFQGEREMIGKKVE